jgi:hypothetical protein
MPKKSILNRTGVYVMANFPYFWKCKFGISGNVKRRRENVSETTKGIVFKLAHANLPYGHALEQWLHGFYGFAHSPFKRGSGRTEWFLNVNPVCLTAYVCAVLVLSPIIWLDGLLWLLIFSLIEAFAIIAIMLAFAYFITQY